MDTTGSVALEAIYRDKNRNNCRLIPTGLQPYVKQLLERRGLLEKLSLENSFATTIEAICSIAPLIKRCTIPLAINLQPKELVASRDKK